jgi:hypothetical protein
LRVTLSTLGAHPPVTRPVGEVLRLNLGDFDLAAGVLTVTLTKWGPALQLLQARR